MTYLYYQTSSTTGHTQKVSEETKQEWKHLSDKSNWRITQLSNGFYQTEVSNPKTDNEWQDITRRRTLEEAEAAIDNSIEYFSKKLDINAEPTVVKTFDNK